MRRSGLSTALLITALVGFPTLAHAQKKSRGDRNRITHDEVVESASTASTAYDLIHIMRPLWLEPAQGRMASARADGGADASTDAGSNASAIGVAADVVVYVNGNRQPSLDQLKTLRVAGILEMRYLDQNRAIQMHGPGHEKGVIEVTLIDAANR